MELTDETMKAPKAGICRIFAVTFSYAENNPRAAKKAVSTMRL
jgi:hypothetical protein